MSRNLSSSREILSRVARALFFRAQFLRPSPPNLSRVAQPCSSIEATVPGRLCSQVHVAAWSKTRRCKMTAATRGLRRLPHGGEPQQDDGAVVHERHGEDAATDLLALRRCKKRRRRWISFVPAQRKKAAREERKESRAGRTRLAGNYRDVGSMGTTRSPRFSGYQNLPSHCAYAKMPSLVHEMPSLPKCISQMQNVLIRGIKTFCFPFELLLTYCHIHWVATVPFILQGDQINRNPTCTYVSCGAVVVCEAEQAKKKSKNDGKNSTYIVGKTCLHIFFGSAP